MKWKKALATGVVFGILGVILIFLVGNGLLRTYYKYATYDAGDVVASNNIILSASGVEYIILFIPFFLMGVASVVVPEYVK